MIRCSSFNQAIESAQSFYTGIYFGGIGKSLSENRAKAAVPPIKVNDLKQIQENLRDAVLPSYIPIVTIDIAE